MKIAVENVRNPLESDIPFRSNLYYRQVVDLRSQGIDAILHFNARTTGTHKIQIVEAGHKCSGEIADTVARITTEHPRAQAISRLDSCSDIFDGPSVEWFVSFVRAKSSQWIARLGTQEVHNVEMLDEKGKKIHKSEMGKREIQTLYMGKRPNCFRVYDKLAERYRAWKLEKQRHERIAAHMVADKCLESTLEEENDPYWKIRFPSLKKFRRDLDKRLKPSASRMFEFPEFKDWLEAQCVGPMGKLLELSELPAVFTRVERQMGAGRVPDKLNTFEKIFSRDAVEFNPFERLEFAPTFALPIRQDDYSVVQYWAGMGIKDGLASGRVTYGELYSRLDRKRNAKRDIKKFEPFIAAAHPVDVPSITGVELYDRYRESLSRQLAA